MPWQREKFLSRLSAEFVGFKAQRRVSRRHDRVSTSGRFSFGFGRIRQEPAAARRMEGGGRFALTQRLRAGVLWGIGVARLASAAIVTSDSFDSFRPV
jgi:hypothetical protein